MTYVRLVRFALAPGKEKTAESLAADLVPEIRSQRGCLQATLFREAKGQEAGLFVRWDSIENADKAAAVIGPQLMQALSGNLQAPPDIRLFDVIGAE